MILAALQEESLFIQYISLGVPFAASAFPFLFLTSPINTTIEEVQLEAIVDSPKDGRATKGEAKPEEKLLSSTEISADDFGNTSKMLEASLELKDRGANAGNPPTGMISPSSPLGRRLRLEVVVFAAILLLLDVGAEIGYGGWLFTYAVEHLKFTDKDAAYVTAVFWGAFMLGRLAAVGIAVFLSSKAMLYSDIIGCSLSLLILVLFPASSTALWVCSVLFGISIASVFPTVISLPQNLGVPVTGTDTSWMVVGASAGEMIVPVMIGGMQERFSMQVLVYVVLIVEILGAVSFSLLLIRVKLVKGEPGPISWFTSKFGKRKGSAKFTMLSSDSVVST